MSEEGKAHFWESRGSLAQHMNEDTTDKGTALKQRAYENQRRYTGDCEAMEQWARDGFMSIGTRHDITEGDEREDGE